MELSEFVISTFNYDQETGIFTYKVRRSQACKVGSIAGSVCKKDGYVRIRINDKAYLAHRLAWLYVHGEMPEEQIDHINGKRSDNRISNLRKAHLEENAKNRNLQRNNSSGFKGVTYSHRHRKWAARIQHDKKQYFLGFFGSPEDAHQAYVEAATRLHGAFANGGHGALVLRSGGQPPEPSIAA